jgi:thiosulfate/3-mercaptopyruvate sulfurtransferase
LNYAFTDSLAEDGRFRSPTEIRQRLQAVIGAAEGEDVIAMCGSGVTACHLLLAMEIAGLPGGRLYAGSWSEWVTDHTRPVATGPVERSRG